MLLKRLWRLLNLRRSRKRLKELATQHLKTELEDLLGSNDVLLYPSHPTVAPPHHKPIYTPFNFAYTGVFNILGFAVTQVPLGLNSKGLPLGVQIVFTGGKDHLTVAVAMELEQNVVGCVPQIFH